MRYPNTLRGVFIDRPNRFIARVQIGGEAEDCHVKNTGRCRELLLPGAQVVLTAAPEGSPRKTRFDLISVYKGERLINIDSQTPNQVAAEYLPLLFPGTRRIIPEHRLGASRLDFLLETEEGDVFVEVKGCTLEREGQALFPDAPTGRGVKHLKELTALARAGRMACLLFVIQMEGVRCISPNDATHPAFGEALREAAGAGVRLLAVDCRVGEGELWAREPVPVHLRME